VVIGEGSFGSGEEGVIQRGKLMTQPICALDSSQMEGNSFVTPQQELTISATQGVHRDILCAV